MRTKIVIGFVAFCMLFVGCSQVQMTQAYRQQLQMATALVSSLNADCQAGDPNACKQGLAEAARTLQLFLDAADGVSSSEEGATP